MKLLSIAVLGLLLPISGALAQTKAPSSTPDTIRLAQAASSCSGWKAICETRGPGCGPKFAQCMKSGCWTEGAAHGGATHCGLAKK